MEGFTVPPGLSANRFIGVNRLYSRWLDRHLIGGYRRNADWWDLVLKRDPCVYCGGLAKTIDHISPLMFGGSRSNIKNRAPACAQCNQRKGNRSLLLFLWERCTGVRTIWMTCKKKFRRKTAGLSTRRFLVSQSRPLAWAA